MVANSLNFSMHTFYGRATLPDVSRILSRGSLLENMCCITRNPMGFGNEHTCNNYPSAKRLYLASAVLYLERRHTRLDNLELCTLVYKPYGFGKSTYVLDMSSSKRSTLDSQTD
jgi:hypothetical protein